jgi:sugar phosphate isomerase/epimerase
MNLQEELGVQSHSLRVIKDNVLLAETVKKMGVSRIELCSSHADFSDESGYEKVLAAYRDAGVTIVSTGVNGMNNDEAKERGFFEFARRAGTRFMSVSFNLASVPDCLRTAEKLADEYDMRLGIHNHGGRHWLGNASALSWILSQTSDRIGLSLDTGWALDAGEDPVEMIEKFSDRLYGVHFKDFTFDRARTPSPVPAGEGVMDLDGVVRALETAGFSGFAVVEHKAESSDPVPDIEKCVAAIRAAG